MLKHADCGGVLKRGLTQSVGKFTCERCGEVVNIGQPMAAVTHNSRVPWDGGHTNPHGRLDLDMIEKRAGREVKWTRLPRKRRVTT